MSMSTPTNTQHKETINSASGALKWCKQRYLRDYPILNDNYDIIRPIGNGSFGRVYLAKSKLDQNEYAVKSINKKSC